jgi:[acyl-carrier-protein] S-malonyltransferase
MGQAGVTSALEIGPGRVLAGLVKRIDKSVSVLSVGDSEGVAKIPDFLGGDGPLSIVSPPSSKLATN